jgi:prepilin-type N-terminal cleavage/methylation domain-containing protein/prepilin-type processing-associated H-X9-DG protein
MYQKAKQGLPLIELLLVIAIIAMLLAIVVPLRRRVKESAWKVICRNDLQQYGLAGRMYMEDCDALFPTAPYSHTLIGNALCEGPQHHRAAADRTVPTSWVPTGGQTYLDRFASFHKTTFDKKESGDSNVVFIDGHVDIVNWKNTYRMARWTNKMPALRQ